MSGDADRLSVQQLYGEIWVEDDPAFEAAIHTSLNPRHADVLYDFFAGFGVGPGDLVLDVGARDARYAVELARRFGCRAVAIDPVAAHLDRARALVAEAGMAGRVVPVGAAIEALPLRDGAVDAVWSRDMLVHVDLPAGLAECFRVLRPGGDMLVYVTLATPALEPAEARRLFAASAIVPANMAPAHFEETARAAGFTIALRDPIDSEWRERWAEEGSRALLDDLLAIARLRRQEDDLVRRFGRARYEASWGGRAWGIYQLLGKLCPTVYLLRKPEG
ncbi:MAG TPA: methyltransferase domain-containing protein [Thermomicrobiaceae bacterium]|nr:methyltransferase domain-containing protein [Thermomicrobiaceae bacterium]